MCRSSASPPPPLMWDQQKGGIAFYAKNNSLFIWRVISRYFFTMMMKWCLMSSDVSWHIRDKLWPMPKHGSIKLYVHGNQKAAQTSQDGHLDSLTAPELWQLFHDWLKVRSSERLCHYNQVWCVPFNATLPMEYESHKSNYQWPVLRIIEKCRSRQQQNLFFVFK